MRDRTTRSKALVIGVAAFLGLGVPGGIPTARASCAAPTEPPPVTHLRVTRCEVIDPQKDKELGPRLAALHESPYYRALVASYEMVYLQGETSPPSGKPTDKPPKLRSTYKLSHGFLVPKEPKVTCADFPVGKELDVVEEFSCCDGDPGPPCMLHSTSR